MNCDSLKTTEYVILSHSDTVVQSKRQKLEIQHFCLEASELKMSTNTHRGSRNRSTLTKHDPV